MIKLSDTLISFEESATLKLAARAKRMRAEGRDVISLAAGEPDFTTPASFLKAAFEKVSAGQTKYTEVQGLLSTRTALCERIQMDYGVQFVPDEALLSNGGKQAIYHFLQAVLQKNDRVLISKPYWVSFPEMVKLVGGVPVFVEPTSGRLTPEELERAWTDDVKLWILNSPGNPDGRAFSPSEIEAFAKVAAKKKGWILSDDTYYRLVYKHPFRSILAAEPSLRDRVCVVGSTSKSYAMPGLRLGWALGPKALIQGMAKLQSQVTSNPGTFAQLTAEYAFLHGEPEVAGFLEIFKRRRELVMQWLRAAQIDFIEPEGAFYIWIRLSPSLEVSKVTPFLDTLLDQHGLCLIPGEAFGQAAFARMSYAASEKDLEEGVRRLAKALQHRS